MNFSDDRINVSPDQTRECRIGSSPIPTDLIIEIFSRLPAKSVTRYHCLSKFWSKVISSQYFKDLFAARSSARPQILFLESKESALLFFSASHPSEKSSDNVATTRLTHYPLSSRYYNVTVPINGLVCVTEGFAIPRYYDRMYKAVIYNPSTTREFLNLPTRTIRANMSNFLVYDPTEKRLKVLFLEYPGYKNFEWDLDVFMDSQVLTLETKEMSWRMIECCKPHYPFGSEICINGVLYYRAIGVFNVQLIVCFDVRSETFKFMKGTKTFDKEPSWAVALINYNGKLGLLIPEESNDFVTGKSKSFEIWVLKDVDKDEWSKHVYILAPLWKSVVGETKLRFVGMIGTNEIVLSSRYQNTTPPCFFYYNIQKDTIRKLNIQGEEGLTKSHDIFLNHVEDLSLFKLLN